MHACLASPKEGESKGFDANNYDRLLLIAMVWCDMMETAARDGTASWRKRYIVVQDIGFGVGVATKPKRNEMNCDMDMECLAKRTPPLAVYVSMCALAIICTKFGKLLGLYGWHNAMRFATPTLMPTNQSHDRIRDNDELSHWIPLLLPSRDPRILQQFSTRRCKEAIYDLPTIPYNGTYITNRKGTELARGKEKGKEWRRFSWSITITMIWYDHERNMLLREISIGSGV